MTGNPEAVAAATLLTQLLVKIESVGLLSPTDVNDVIDASLLRHSSGPAENGEAVEFLRDVRRYLLGQRREDGARPESAWGK